MLELYFIRHGQSVNNAILDFENYEKYIFKRVVDPDLTSIGEKQARLAGKYLARPVKTDENNPHNRHGFGITHIYCSLMQRAIKTGLAISHATGIPLEAWPEVHETGGVFEAEMQDGEPVLVGRPGKGKSFFQEKFPNLIIPEDIPETGWWNKDKEPREQYRIRSQAILDRLMREHGGGKDRVAIITHGGIFTRIVSTLLDVHAERYWLLMNNCGISRINLNEDGRFTLMYINKVDFLPDELIT